MNNCGRICICLSQCVIHLSSNVSFRLFGICFCMCHLILDIGLRFLRICFYISLCVSCLLLQITLSEISLGLLNISLHVSFNICHFLTDICHAFLSISLCFLHSFTCHFCFPPFINLNLIGSCSIKSFWYL